MAIVKLSRNSPLNKRGRAGTGDGYCWVWGEHKQEQLMDQMLLYTVIIKSQSVITISQYYCNTNKEHKASELKSQLISKALTRGERYLAKKKNIIKLPSYQALYRGKKNLT